MWILFQLKRMELKVMTWRHRLNATVLDINSNSDGDVWICWEMFNVFYTLHLEATSHMFHPSWLYQRDTSLWISCILSTRPSQSVAGVCVFNPVIATANVSPGFAVCILSRLQNMDICRHSNLPQHLEINQPETWTSNKTWYWNILFFKWIWCSVYINVMTNAWSFVWIFLWHREAAPMPTPPGRIRPRRTVFERLSQAPLGDWAAHGRCKGCICLNLWSTWRAFVCRITWWEWNLHSQFIEQTCNISVLFGWIRKILYSITRKGSSLRQPPKNQPVSLIWGWHLIRHTHTHMAIYVHIYIYDLFIYLFIYLSIYLFSYLVCHYVTSILHDTEQCNPICSQSTVLFRIKCKANLPLFATCGRGDTEAKIRWFA